MLGDYFTYIEQEKSKRLSEMHRLTGGGELIKRELLSDRNVILVSDGFATGFLIDLAAEFLKPISIKKMIIATPLASVPAVDRMHIQADEIFCLSVVEDYISTDHYYDKQDVPDHDKITATIEKLVTNWQ
jgi:predicted phosphoribosyltransferase